MTATWTLALLAATHAFQPHAPVQRLRPLRVEVFDEATLLIEQAVEWSRAALHERASYEFLERSVSTW